MENNSFWHYYDLFDNMPYEYERDYLLNHRYKGHGLRFALGRIYLGIKNLLFYRNSNQKNVILAVYKRFPEIIKTLSKEYNVFSIEHDASYRNQVRNNSRLYRYDITWFEEDLRKAYLTHNEFLLQRALKKIRKYIKKADPQLCILMDIHSPSNRAFAYECKKINVKVVWFEHGISEPFLYNSDSRKKELFAKNYIDYRLVWSENNKQLLAKYSILERGKIYVVGFPNELPVRIEPKEIKYRILFCGDSLNSSGPKKNMYYQVVNLIHRICKDKGVDFAYRNHQKEDEDDLRLYLDKDISIEREDIDSAFSNYGVVIGVYTTILIEAAMRGCIIAQVEYDDNVLIERKYKTAHQVYGNSEELDMFVQSVKTKTIIPFSIDQDDMLTIPMDPGIRIMSAVKWVISNSYDL